MNMPSLDWRLAIGGFCLGAIGLFLTRQARNIARQNRIMIDCGEASSRWSFSVFGPPWTDRRHIKRIGWSTSAFGILLLVLSVTAGAAR
jgi:hypothetical protein